ncbi:hypothetical protein HDU79_009460 [Rhizoclosmatium sp. JEL0117]|nr:hypothetical protein HDU79_009460 [Rhizoclosmatium sp. JEL0117]
MVQITQRLNVSFTTFNPGFLGGLGMKGDRANDIINDGLVRLMCNAVDVIIVADTMPDARPLFQSLVRDNPEDRCKANIILELTTRFDWGIPDGQEYYKLNWKLAHQKPKNLFWVTNNAFEPLDLSYEALATPYFRLLRPTGYSTLEAKTLSEEDKQLAMCREESHSAVLAIMRRMEIPFKHINGGYGGPKTLANYKAFIEFPYQVSTMKLYENLAAGVLMLFPSKDFFRELVEKDLHAFGPWDKISRAGEDWHLYMDYYAPDIAPYVYYFDSFDQLKAMLTSKGNLDTKNVRIEAPKAYKKLVNKMLHGWADLFGEMGYQVTVDGEPHTQGSGEPAFQVPLYSKKVLPPNDERAWEDEFRKLDQWRNLQRIERVQRARTARASITELEMEAYVTSLERQNPSAKAFLQLDPIYDGIDNALIQLLDFLSGERGAPAVGNEIVFGGSLQPVHASKGGLEEWLAESGDGGKAMKAIYDMVIGIPPNKLIGPSNYGAISKVQRSFRLLHTLFGLTDLQGDVRVKSIHPPSEKELSALLSADAKLNLSKKLKTFSRTVYPWAFSNRFLGMKDLIQSFIRPRGIVLSFGKGGFEQGLLNIMHIRKNLNCQLPVQVFYNGMDDLDTDKIEALNRIEGVSTKNLQEVFSGLAEDRNFHSKPFAILASSFQQVIYIDDDIVLFQNPETVLKNSEIFAKYGTLFFKGPSFDFGSSKWVRWFVKMPSNLANSTGRYFRDLSKDEMDASLMLFDKSRLEVVHGLMAACHLNLKEVREGGMDKYLQGDKETYWLAFEILRIPYQFVPGIAGAAGSLQIKNGKTLDNSVCGPQSHLDEHGKLLHVNSRSARYNNELDKWEKSLSHYIAPVSEEPGNIDSTQQPWCVSAGTVAGVPVPKEKAVFAVGKEEKALLLRLRELSMEMRHEGWKHYLDNHV